MEKTLTQLEFDKISVFLAEHAISNLGKLRCKELVLYDNIQKIKEEQTLTTQAKQILNQGNFPPLEDFADITSSLEKIKQLRVLSAEEIIDIAKILRFSRVLKNFFDKKIDEFREISLLRANLKANKELEDLLFDTFESDLTIKDEASAELKRLRMSKKDTELNIKNTIKNLLSNTNFVSNLQDNIYTIRDDRIVFQVKAECKNKVPGIVHDISQTGTTFFIEPKELITVSNKLREINILINAEIEKILRELSRKINEYNYELAISVNQLADYDFIFAKAKYSIKTDSSEPYITDKREVVLKGMKNPVLMTVCDNVVENDFDIGQDYKTLIITGSNTGGKTVALKTVGLCILMAKAGLHVPCYEAKIYPFKKIFMDIGDEQNIIESLSTFSSRMKNLINIINNSDEETIVFLDEIVSGTDPKEGASLAQAILDYFNKNNTLCVVTTHYSELKSLAYLNSDYKNASVDFNLDTLQPTYKLIIGIPGVSHAIEISKNLGIPEEISNKAQNLYYSQKDDTAQVLNELKSTHFELTKSAEKVTHLKEQEEATLKEYNDKLEELKKDKKKLLLNFKKKFETKFHVAKNEIQQVLDEIRKEKSEKIARRALSRLGQMENQSREVILSDEEELSEIYTPLDINNLKIGDKAILKNLNQEVEILSMPDKKGLLQIQMGLIKTTVEIDKLAQYSKNAVKKSLKTRTVNFKEIHIEKRELSQTLDLRGYRLENALDELENYLDKASLSNLSPVYVIHGHGTGVLKQYLREYLQTSPYVKTYRAGENAEGGDGVTVVEIK